MKKIKLSLLGVVLGLLTTFQNCSSFNALSNPSSSSSQGTTDSPSSPAFAIEQHPQSVSVPLGTTVNFQVVARGPQTLHYAWFKNNVIIPNSDNAILTLASIAAENQGNYLVVVTSGTLSTTSNTATLTITNIAPSPSATPTPTPTPTASASPEPSPTPTPTPSPTPTVNPPAIVTQPSNVSVAEGSAFQIAVTATGTDIQYQWYFNGSAIGGANQSVFNGSGVLSSGGSYYVIVSNSVGQVQSNSVTVTVNPAVPAGTLAATQTFYGTTASCDFNPPDVTFTAPTTGAYYVYSYIAAPGAYHFVLPYFSLQDAGGNSLVYQVLTNELSNDGNTFFRDNSQTQTTTVQLYQGQTYRLRQRYWARWCYEGHSADVYIGTTQVYFQGIPAFSGCAADTDKNLTQANPFEIQMPRDTTNIHVNVCFNNGTWIEAFTYQVPPPEEPHTGGEGGN